MSPITRGGIAATRASLGGRPSCTVCSAAAKSITSQVGGAGSISTPTAVDNVDRGLLTRGEVLTGFVASIVSSAALLSEVSRARADGDAGPGGLGVVDDLLADCPSVRGDIAAAGVPDDSHCAFLFLFDLFCMVLVCY